MNRDYAFKTFEMVLIHLQTFLKPFLPCLLRENIAHSFQAVLPAFAIFILFYFFLILNTGQSMNFTTQISVEI